MSEKSKKKFPMAVYDQTIEMPKPTTNVDQGIKDLEHYGLTIHENFISEDFAGQLRERIEEQAYMERKKGAAYIGARRGQLEREESIEGHVEEPIYQAMRGLPNKGREFIDLFMNKTALEYAERTFSPYKWNLWGMNAIITRKGSLDQPLHVDVWLPTEMNTRAAMINCFIAISDFEPEMGATGFVPGSHNTPYPGYNNMEVFTTPRVQPPFLKAGTAIIWEGRTWHGQCAHNSDKTRYALAMSYCLHTYRQGENYAASVHDDVYETLTDDERRVLGMYTDQTGFLGYFGPRNASDKRVPLGEKPQYMPEMHRDN